MERPMARAFVIASLLLSGSALRADIERSRVLFLHGSAAYEAGRLDEALTTFREAYLQDRNPAFLFNMAVCLERLQRPHDAAEELRAYLRAQPGADSRGEIESRIRGLDEAQRILDAERLRSTPPQLLAVTPVRSWWTRRRTLAVVLGGVGGVTLAVGLGVGLGLGLKPHYPSTTLDTQVVTP